MNTPMRPTTPRHVPTLTEVIEVDSLLEPAGQLVADPEPVPELVQASGQAFVQTTTSAPERVTKSTTEVLTEAAAAPAPEVAAPNQAQMPVVPLSAADLQDAPIPRAMLIDRSPWASSALGKGLSAAEPAALSSPPRTAAMPASTGASSVPGVPGGKPMVTAAVDEALITQRVMADLQRQIDGMLEYRLRETLAPILARTTEALVRELRQELSKTMKDVVARSVAQEVARQRSRG